VCFFHNKTTSTGLSAVETISLNYCYGYDVAIEEPTCPAPLEAAHVRRVHLAPHARNACAPVERRSAATAQQFSAAWARPDLNRLTEPDAAWVPRTDGRSSVCFERTSLRKNNKKRVTVAHQLPCEHKSQSQKVWARNKQPQKGETLRNK